MTYTQVKKLQLNPTGEFRSFQTAILQINEALDLISQKVKALKTVAKHDFGVLDCDDSKKYSQTMFQNSRQAWNALATIEDALWRLEKAQVE